MTTRKTELERFRTLLRECVENERIGIATVAINTPHARYSLNNGEGPRSMGMAPLECR